MDAVKFIEERRRMNRHNAGQYAVLFGGMSAIELVKETEEWSITHPRKTRQSVFLEQYPLAKRNYDGALVICPQALYANFSCPYESSAGIECPTCKHNFWMEEVE